MSGLKTRVFYPLLICLHDTARKCWPSIAVTGISARKTSAVKPDDHEDGVTVRDRPLVSKKEEAKPEQPPLYAVILLNDDYTPRDFVTQILKRHFGLDGDTAHTIMMHAHRHGEARVGAWEKDIAESKMHNAEEEAHEEGHPLRFRCHPVEP